MTDRHCEGRVYLAHPVLGPRLDICTRAVPKIKGPSLKAIFGSPDDMKFRSCATLFALAAGQAVNPFQCAVYRWCDGPPEEQTLGPIRGEP